MFNIDYDTSEDNEENSTSRSSTNDSSQVQVDSPDSSLSNDDSSSSDSCHDSSSSDQSSSTTTTSESGDSSSSSESSDSTTTTSVSTDSSTNSEPSDSTSTSTDSGDLSSSSESSDSTETTTSETDFSFSIDSSILPDNLSFTDSVVGEQEVPDLISPSEVTEGLIAEIDSIDGVNDSILAEEEMTINEMYDSLGIKDDIYILDFRDSDQQDKSDILDFSSDKVGSNQQLSSEENQEHKTIFEDLNPPEVKEDILSLDFTDSDDQENLNILDSSSGLGLTQQFLMDSVQDQQQDEISEDQVTDESTDNEYDHLTDGQEPAETIVSEDEGSSTQDQSTLSEQEYEDKIQEGDEYADEKHNTMEPYYDQVVGETTTQEMFDQLVQDYQTSLEQRAAFEEDQFSDEEQEEASDQQPFITSDELINDVDENDTVSLSQQEESEEKITVSEPDIDYQFTSNETDSYRITSFDFENEEKTLTNLNISSNELFKDFHETQHQVIQNVTLNEDLTSITDHEEYSLVSEVETTHLLETSLLDNTNYSYFSPQESINARLLSELYITEAIHESTINTVSDPVNVADTSSSELAIHNQSTTIDPETISITSTVFHNLESEISDIENYLTTLDSPRILEQFHEQLQNEVDELLLIDDLQPLPDLDDSLELISEEPSLPEPPPYDFLQDLEEQEEAKYDFYSTRSHLLWSLQQARLRQEAANYNFALRNIPTLQTKINNNNQRGDSQKSPSSSKSMMKDTKELNLLENDTIQQKETQKTLDQFISPESSNNRNSGLPKVISSERGIWGHLALHLPLLGNAGTDEFLDSLIQTNQQKNDIAIAITDKAWSQVKNTMLGFANKRKIRLDPRIMDKIIDWSETQLSIERNSIQDGTKWVIESNSTRQEHDYNLKTEIIFKSTGWIGESFEGIKTININQLQPQVNFDEWMFRSYEYWNSEISNVDKSSLKENRYQVRPKCPVNTEYDNPDPLFVMGKAIFPLGIRPHNFQFVKWKQSIRGKLNIKVDLRDSKSYKLQLIRIHMRNLWENEEKIWFIQPTIREDIYDKLKSNPSEENVRDLLGQIGVLDGILAYERNFNEGDSIFIREQVTVKSLSHISKNTAFKRTQVGMIDLKQYRRPDRVVLIRRDQDSGTKIELAIFDEKKSKKYFSHSSNTGGYGRAQPLRDAHTPIRETIKACKEYFPNIKEKDIEVSCSILTARVEEDTIVIEGEELFHRIPASHVLPYSGLVISDDNEFYDLIDDMKFSYYNEKEYNSKDTEK